MKKKENKPLEYSKAIIYCRVSSERQAREGHGLDSQEHRCRDYADQRGLKVEKVFRDTFTGGGNFMARPEMRLLLDFLDKNAHENYVIIFDDLKRLARDLEFHFKLRKELRIRNAKPECLNFNFDETAEGKFVEGVIAGVGELEKAQNRQQVIQKQKARLEAGYWSFGPKKGYIHLRPSPNENIQVKPDGTTSLVLKEALEGFGIVFPRLIDCCRFLVEKGAWTKQRPDKYIDKFKEIVMDPFYAGFIAYPKWNVAMREAKHEGIISFDTFQRNQKYLKREEKSHRIRMDVNPEFELRGLLKCSHCNEHLTAAWSKGRTKKYAYYTCRNKSCCVYGKSTSANEIHDGFKKILKEQTMKPEVGQIVESYMTEAWSEEISDFKKQEALKALEIQALSEKIKQITNLIVSAKNEQLRSIYEGELEDLALKRNEISSSRYESMDLNIPYRTALEKATLLLKNPYSIWQSVDVEEKQKLFYFIFEEKLQFSKIEGYRTEKIPTAVRIFQEIVGINTLDVEMGGIEPPCK